MPAALFIMATLILPLPAHADSLTDILTATYDSHPAIKAKREELKALDENVSQALAGWRPTVEANYTKGRKRTDFAGTGRRYTDDDSKSLVIDQPLFSGGETLARTRSAKSLVLSGRADLRNTEQETLFGAVQAYMAVLRSESVLSLSSNNASVLRQQLKASKERFEVGELTRTDVAQSEARVSRAEADENQAKGQADIDKAAFRRVVGFDAGTLAMPATKLSLPATVEEAQELALSNNPRVDVSKYREVAAQNDIDVGVAAILPDVSLRGAFNRQDNVGTLGNSSLDSDSVTVNVSIPLYQGGAEYSAVREAENVAQRRKFEALDTYNQVRETVNRSWQQYVTAKNAIHSREDAIKAAQIALEGVKQEQEFGARTTLDVLDQEQELFQAKVELVRAQHDQVVSEYGLLAAIGRLNPQELALNAQSYDPEKHYEKVKYKLIGF